MKRPVARKLPSGAWNCQVVANGKRISITDESRKVCEAKAYAVKAGIAEQKKHPERITLGAAIDRFISDRENVLSPSTIKAYKSYRKHRFQEYMDVQIGNLDRHTLQMMVNEEAIEKSAKTVRNAWTLVASSLNECNVDTAGIKLPTLSHNERSFLDYEEINKFCQLVQGKSFEITALLALHSLRRSEIYALRWEDIDLKNKTITVNGAAVYNADGELVRKTTTKTSASRRTIPIFIPRLHELLCVADKTKPITNEHIQTSYYQINKVCEKNGLPLVGLHGLRHSFASLCHHLGIPEMECAMIGGWNDLNTMRNIYTHVAEQDKIKSMSKLTEYFADKM